MAGWYTEVHYPDGLVQYGCWSTSTDGMWSGLHDDKADAGSPGTWTYCTCGETPEAVRVWAGQLSLGHWAGTACRRCHYLDEGRAPVDEYDNRTLPDLQPGSPTDPEWRW